METKGLGRLWKRPAPKTNRPFEIELTAEEKIRQKQRHLRAGCLFIIGAFILGLAFWIILAFKIFS